MLIKQKYPQVMKFREQLCVVKTEPSVCHLLIFKFIFFLSNHLLKSLDYTDLLLAEFSVRTVNYGPSVFFPSIYGPSAKRAGHKSMEKNENP